MWVDVTQGDWFYDEVTEATNISLEDGSPFVEGLPYNIYVQGSPYIYEEYTAGEGQKVFNLTTKITPTADNPLYVYIDGVQTMYSSIQDTADGKSSVTLYTAPRAGALVSFASYGKPAINTFGKPVPYNPFTHPTYTLSKAGSYIFDKFNRYYQEYVYAFGRQLKRAPVLDSDWISLTGEQVAMKYIRYKTDTYCISPSGVIYMPFNLNNVTCSIVYNYMDGIVKNTVETFKPVATTIAHIDRFFPQAYITRAEAFILLDRLRKTFYSRFTDTDAPSDVIDETVVAYTGQTIFKINGSYHAGEGRLQVTVDDEEMDYISDYKEVDEHTVLFRHPMNGGEIVHFYYAKVTGSRFVEINRDLDMIVQSTGEHIPLLGNVDTSWWSKNIIAMEDEKLSDGSYLIEGIEVTYYDDNYNPIVDDMYNPIEGNQPPLLFFMPHTLMTRAQAVTILNRFRKWTIERFKY